MYNLVYWYNLLEAIFWKSNTYLLKNNFTVFAIYPTKRWILKEFNAKLLEKIKSLKSFYCINILKDKYIWKEIWLTKDGFKKVWWIRFLNNDIKQFNKDYLFVEENYKDLLILE